MIYDSVKKLCLDQLALYPRAQAQDLVKALYQNRFGCGHLISHPEQALAFLTEEAQSLTAGEKAAPLAETLGDSFCRVHLRAAKESGLSIQTLFRLFLLSAREPADGTDIFHTELEQLEALISSGEIPLPSEASSEFIRRYRAAGCPATHHSDIFRREYAPAYRVVSSGLCRFLPVFLGIDRLLAGGKPVTVAIEGGSAGGKTTLAAILEQVYGCNVFHMDDFFLRPCQRTPQRLAQPGGNVDYERFKSEVLDRLAVGKPFSYRPFDCSTMSLTEPVGVTPKKLTVVEGAYSMHPALGQSYDFSVFLRTDADTQTRRILHRNGQAMLERFLTEWIPMENRYFEHFNIPGACSVSIEPAKSPAIS